MAANDNAVRTLLQKLLNWEDAHVGFETAVTGIPSRLRGKRPDVRMKARRRQAREETCARSAPATPEKPHCRVAVRMRDRGRRFCRSTASATVLP